ncbi:MAG: hypothetical protein ACLUKN_09660 [Bacilli bacterium]
MDWASGWKDVYYGENCADEWRTPHLACGKAGTSVFDIVCLGDGGSITMTFDNAIFATEKDLTLPSLKIPSTKKFWSLRT